MPDKPAIFSDRRRDAGGHGRASHDYLSGRFGDEARRISLFTRRALARAALEYRR